MAADQVAPLTGCWARISPSTGLTRFSATTGIRTTMRFKSVMPRNTRRYHQGSVPVKAIARLIRPARKNQKVTRTRRE